MGTQGNELHGIFVNLRPLVAGDAELTFAWRQSARSRFLNKGSRSVAEQRTWIDARPSSEYNFIIELKNGTPVGMLSLINIDHTHRHAEPSRFLIGEEQAVRGIPAAIEATKILYELTFDELKLLRVFGTVAEENVQMIRWQKFLGMKEEGRLRRHLFIDGRFQDAICLGLLEPEYRNFTLPRLNMLLKID